MDVTVFYYPPALKILSGRATECDFQLSPGRLGFN